MTFLFFFINLFFAAFFFLFRYYVESMAFVVIAWVSLFYFSSLFHSLQDDGEHLEVKETEKSAFSLKDTFLFIKKWSFYLGFLFFYLSLYGISYGMNTLYGHLDAFALFQILLLVTSLCVTGALFVLSEQNRSFILLAFRSNFLIFSLIYSLFLLFFFFTQRQIDVFFVVNSLFSLLGLAGLLYIDPNWKRMEYVYSLFLVYLFLVVYFYTFELFGLGQKSVVLILEWLMLSILYFELFPKIPFLKPYVSISKYLGIGMNYLAFIALSAYLIFHPLTPLLGIVSLCAAGFHLLVHFRFRNYVSYLFFLGYLIFFYAKLFFPDSAASFLVYLLFIFGLPALLIGSTLRFRIKYTIDNYFLHYSGLLFSLIASGYYFFIVSEPDVLKSSTILLLESMFLFASYLSLKK